MSDVFISYARSTEAQAKQVAEGLQALGYSVWRDEDLPSHRAYADVIAEQLGLAKAVVVVWSEEAVRSQWVRSEADRARGTDKLVQLAVDSTVLPMPFDQIQCSDLSCWAGEPDRHGWRKIVESVAALAGLVAPPTALASSLASPQSARREVETDNLPKRLPGLIGRDADLEALKRLLARADLVTLTGTGGVGKTRLAVEVAQHMVGQFEDGVWLVELAPVTEGGHVPAAVARAMAVELPVGKDPFEALVDRLRLRRCLILLDNCEHVIDAAAAFAEAILEASNDIKLLASSQEPLGVEAEQVYRLRSLAEVDAATLFAERASAAEADFAVRPRDEGAVGAICARLDGIPLAIEMAAARAPSLGCQGVLERLDDRFRLLTGGRRTAVPRQRTLAATLDWSHGLLSERDAAVFRRLGAFSGGFTLEAASSVASGEDLDGLDVVDGISSLVAKSLVAADPGAERPRYRLLETTRAYALEKLDSAGETLEVQRRHADWFLGFTRTVSADYDGHVSDDDFAARYFGENDNLERAVDWCFGPGGDPELGIALVGFSESIWVWQSLYGVYLGWLERAAAHVGPTTPLPVRARFFSARASALMMTTPVRALEVVDETIEAARALGDPIELARALNAKGFSLYSMGRGAEAVELAEESMRTIATLATGRTPTQSKMLAGTLRGAAARPEAAVLLMREGIADLRDFGAEGLANWFEQTLFFVAAMQPGEAVDFWRALLARVRPRDMLADLTMNMAIDHLLSALAQRGDPSDLEEAINIYRRYYRLLAVGMGRAFASGAMANVAFKQECLREAAMLLAYSEGAVAALGVSAYFPNSTPLREALIQAVAPADLDAWTAAGAKLSEDEALKLPLGEAL